MLTVNLLRETTDLDHVRELILQNTAQDDLEHTQEMIDVIFSTELSSDERVEQFLSLVEEVDEDELFEDDTTPREEINGFEMLRERFPNAFDDIRSVARYSMGLDDVALEDAALAQENLAEDGDLELTIPRDGEEMPGVGL